MGRRKLDTVYRKAKRDKNEKRLVDFLRRCGASIAYLDDPGVPDLLVGYCGLNLLMEVKGQKGRLTSAQKSFIQNWSGTVYVVRTIRDVKLALRSECLRHNGCLRLATVSQKRTAQEAEV
jgi:hypothetical protein